MPRPVLTPLALRPSSTRQVTANFGKRLAPLGMTVRELTGDMQLSKKELAETQMVGSWVAWRSSRLLLQAGGPVGGELRVACSCKKVSLAQTQLTALSQMCLHIQPPPRPSRLSRLSWPRPNRSPLQPVFPCAPRRIATKL